MPTVPITRHCVDVGGRNVHYRRRGEGPPVLLLHASPRSSQAMLPLMEAAPDGVCVLAFDTPGCGASDGLGLDDPGAGDFARAFADTLEALGLGRAAVYGTHTGAAIAMAFAVRFPERVATLLLDGLSVFDADEQARLLGAYLPSFAPESDASHLARLWSRVRDQHLFFPWNEFDVRTRLWRPLPPAGLLHDGALDLLRAGDAYRAPYRAAIRYAPPQESARLRVPTLVGARPDDVLFTHLARLPAPGPGVRIDTLPADAVDWAARVWSELLRHRTLHDTPAPPPVDALPAARIGSAIAGPAGARVHLRGALGGTGRPRVRLHDSPGCAGLLDGLLRSEAGTRPVIAPDLPAHGDSDRPDDPADATETAERLDAALRACGLVDADVDGAGFGGAVASTLARLQPRRYRAAPATPPGSDARAAPPTPPRLDGGHLFAAWFHARDTAILGPAWSADARRRHDFGAGLDLDAVQRLCTAALAEAPEASVMREALLRSARAGR